MKKILLTILIKMCIRDRNIATSLKKEWNIEYDREEIIIKIIEKLEKVKELAKLLDIQINSCII